MRILERQGRLSDDLNWVQRFGLIWLMDRDVEDEITLERIRNENHALASNPNTSPKYLEHLLLEKEILEDEEEFGQTEWRTPTSMEEAEEVAQALGLRITE